MTFNISKVLTIPYNKVKSGLIAILKAIRKMISWIKSKIFSRKPIALDAKAKSFVPPTQEEVEEAKVQPEEAPKKTKKKKEKKITPTVNPPKEERVDVVTEVEKPQSDTPVVLDGHKIAPTAPPKYVAVETDHAVRENILSGREAIVVTDPESSDDEAENMTIPQLSFAIEKDMEELGKLATSHPAEFVSFSEVDALEENFTPARKAKPEPREEFKGVNLKNKKTFESVDHYIRYIKYDPDIFYHRLKQFKNEIGLKDGDNLLTFINKNSFRFGQFFPQEAATDRFVLFKTHEEALRDQQSRNDKARALAAKQSKNKGKNAQVSIEGKSDNVNQIIPPFGDFKIKPKSKEVPKEVFNSAGKKIALFKPLATPPPQILTDGQKRVVITEAYKSNKIKKPNTTEKQENPLMKPQQVVLGDKRTNAAGQIAKAWVDPASVPLPKCNNEEIELMDKRKYHIRDGVLKYEIRDEFGNLSKIDDTVEDINQILKHVAKKETNVDHDPNDLERIEDSLIDHIPKTIEKCINTTIIKGDIENLSLINEIFIDDIKQRSFREIKYYWHSDLVLDRVPRVSFIDKQLCVAVDDIRKQPWSSNI